MQYFLALKAEVLHLAGRTPEALEAITEAEAWVERSEERAWSAEPHRLRTLFLAALGAEESQIEASFCEAIRIANEQRSVSLDKRVEATYEPTRNTVAKKRAGWEDVDSDYLFGDFILRSGFRSIQWDKPCGLAFSMHVSREMERD